MHNLMPDLLRGLLVTVQVTGGAAMVALLAMFIAGTARLSGNWILNKSAQIYIEIFRGTSALVQLFWVYFALPIFGIRLPAMTAGIVVMGLNTGAYAAEVFRGAVLAVPQTQVEAAVALNMTRSQRLWRILIPQAMPVVLPPLTNLLIDLLKNTALVSLITVHDLTAQAQILRTENLAATGEIYTSDLLIYFAVALIISAGMRRAERLFRYTHRKAPA